ncbi:amidohydrolase family protein, partial [Flavobacterium franklandianum]
MKKNHFLLLATLFICSAASSQDYYLHCGKILNTLSGKELTNQTILVSKNKITKVQEGFIAKVKPEDIEINLKNKYVLPGLIDLHVHIEGEHDTKSYMSKYID